MGRPVRLVVCVNQRLGIGQRSCAGSGSLELISRLEAKLTEEKMQVPVVRRECLGHCEQGPVMRIAPAGPFFHEIDAGTLDVIIAELKTFIARHNA